MSGPRFASTVLEWADASRSWSADMSPAPGISRSIRYCGMVRLLRGGAGDSLAPTAGDRCHARSDQPQARRDVGRDGDPEHDLERSLRGLVPEPLLREQCT